MKKLLAVGVIVLFLGVAIAPSTGNRVFNDDTTPPVTTCTLDPPEPDGDNGWYVRDVEVTLNATDDMSGVTEIRYRIGLGSWQTIPGDYGGFVVDDDGNDIPIEYYAIDNAGNEEEINSFTIDMDQTVPEMETFYWGYLVNDSKRFIRFKVICRGDLISGMNRVEFYFNNNLTFTDYEEPYEWIIEISEGLPGVYKAMAFDNAGNCIYDDGPFYAGYKSFIGVICNPEISNQNVTFFTILVRYEHGSEGIPDTEFIMLKRLTLPNNYEGYIGKFFIWATFYNI